MNKWVVGLEVCLIIIVLTYPLQTRAFVSVDGYFRNDGTYVESHVRSEPNAFTFDKFGSRI